MAQYLSDSIVKRLPLPAHHDVTTKDTLVRGFGIRVTAAGARSFTLNYRRKADGRQRRLTIGTFPDWTTVQAREEAKRLKRAIDNGGDPVGEQEGIRTAPTIADLCQRFIADYLPRKRPSTQRVYKQQIAAEILPAFGQAKVAAVSHGDVDQWHHRLSKRGPTHANRTLAVLSKMFSLAVRWQMRPDNPCRGIERNQEHKRQRYLTAEEMARLATALTELADQNAANAVRLLLLTGARRGELLAARWVDFDLKARQSGSSRGRARSRRSSTVSRCRLRPVSFCTRCGCKLATRRCTCSLPATVATGPISIVPGSPCVRQRGFPTFGCMTYATLSRACWLRQVSPCR